MPSALPTFRAGAALMQMAPCAARHACRTCRWRGIQSGAANLTRRFWSSRPQACPQTNAAGRGSAALSTEAAMQPCNSSETLRLSSDDTDSHSHSLSAVWPGLRSWRALDADKRRQWLSISCVEVQPEPCYLASVLVYQHRTSANNFMH